MSALEPGDMIEVVVAGRAIVICNVDGALRAVDAVCPHAGGPIADGELIGQVVTCPWHGWAFDVRTGRCAVDDDARLESWPVEVRRGRAFVIFEASGGRS